MLKVLLFTLLLLLAMAGIGLPISTKPQDDFRLTSEQIDEDGKRD